MAYQMCFIRRLIQAMAFWFNLICEFNHIQIILYITPWYL